MEEAEEVTTPCFPDPAPPAEPGHPTQVWSSTGVVVQSPRSLRRRDSQRDLAESQGQAGPVLSSRQRGAVAAPQLHRPAGRASGPQQEVKVGRGVHGIEDVGVIWDHQF